MDILISKVIQIAKESGIQKVILFGSRARGDATERSDYDFAFVSSNLNHEIKSRIKDRIDEIDTLYKVDIVFLPHLKGDDKLTQSIVREGVRVMDKFQYKFTNYKSAVLRLNESIEDYKNVKLLSVRDGAIQRFEFTTELAWKTMREYLLAEQIIDINSPKAVLKEAFSNKLINDEEGWRDILNDRNATSHIYDEETANEIYHRIGTKHVELFQDLIGVLNKK